MEIQRIRNVILPSRGTLLSAGIDFYTPNDIDEIILKPNESCLIPSGIVARVPKKHMLCAFNKSGIVVKQGLSVGACVVDEDYDLEIHLHVINTSLVETIIKPGQKLIQFVLIPVNYESIEEVEELPKRISERKGGFGSTGI